MARVSPDIYARCAVCTHLSRLIAKVDRRLIGKVGQRQ